jgi:hypothetical protein
MSIRCGRVVQTLLHARGYLDTKIASRNIPAAPLPVWVATACVGRTFLSDAFDLSVALWTSHTLWVATSCVGRTFLSDAFDLYVALSTSHTLWAATAFVGRTFLSDAFDLWAHSRAVAIPEPAREFPFLNTHINIRGPPRCGR